MNSLGYCWAHAGEHAEAGDCVRWSLLADGSPIAPDPNHPIDPETTVPKTVPWVRLPVPDGPAPVASETTPPPPSADARIAELRQKLANAKDDLAAVVSVNVALSERLKLDEEHRMRNGNYAAGYAAGAREAASRPALTAHEVNAAAVSGVVTVLAAEKSTPAPRATMPDLPFGTCMLHSGEHIQRIDCAFWIERKDTTPPPKPSPPDRNVLRDLRAARELLARWLDSEMTDHDIRNIQSETREFLGLKP